MADSPWQQAGLHLRAAFDHVWVLTLPGSSQRAGYMRQSLEEGLRLPRSFLTYFEGASGHEWGTWPRVDFLRRARAAAPASEGQSWWMAPSCAAGQTERCLLPKFRSCATANGSVPRLCNELCYTLSVLAALDDFLRSPHEVALLLEDDVCPTAALLTGGEHLQWLKRERGTWDLVKLADCRRGLVGVPLPKTYRPRSRAEKLQTGRCVSRDTRPHRNRNALLPGLAPGYCSHALGVSRRMARQLLSDAFPVTDCFDNFLALRVAPAIGQSSMRYLSLNLSFFAQAEKGGLTAGQVPPALRSQNRGKPHQVSLGASSAAERHRRQVH